MIEPRNTTSNRPRNSTQIDWIPFRGESYSEGTFEFDVSIAKTYLASHPVPVESFRAEQLSDWMHCGPTRSEQGRWAAPLDGARVAGADTKIPLILVEILDRRFLIDGHHRLERGRQLGRTEFPTVVIRDMEAARNIMRPRTPYVVYWWTWTVRRRLRSWGRRHPASLNELDGGPTPLAEGR